MTEPDVEYRRMKLRRSTAFEWTTDNPVLALGEEGYETDSRRRKVGDGSTHWIDLHYAGVVDLLGTAAYVDTGATVGTVPLLNSSDRLDAVLLGSGSGDPALFLNGDGDFAAPVTSLTPVFTTPTLSGVTVPSGYAPVRYTKDAIGFVHIEGVVTFTGTGAAGVFTLPAGFRPAAKVQFMASAATSGAAASVLIGTVSSAGVVALAAVPPSVPATWIATLACIFYADA